MKCPCIECNRRGCGVYHDRCIPYQEFRKWKSEAQREITKDYIPCRLWIREDTYKGRIGKLRKRRRR